MMDKLSLGIAIFGTLACILMTVRDLAAGDTSELPLHAGGGVLLAGCVVMDWRRLQAHKAKKNK